MWLSAAAALAALCRPAIVPIERRTVALSTGLQMEWLMQPAASAVGRPVLFVHGTFHGAWCWAEVRVRSNRARHAEKAVTSAFPRRSTGCRTWPRRRSSATPCHCEAPRGRRLTRRRCGPPSTWPTWPLSSRSTFTGYRP